MRRVKRLNNPYTFPLAVSIVILILILFYIPKNNQLIHQRQQEIQTLRQEIEQIEQQNERLRERLKEIENTNQLMKEFLDSWNFDTFVVTAYSPYDDQNRLNSDGNPESTAIGIRPGPGTVAVNPKIIPYGSRIMIRYADGSVERGKALDTGAHMRKPGNLQIDTFRWTYKEAMEHGRPVARVAWSSI